MDAEKPPKERVPPTGIFGQAAPPSNLGLPENVPLTLAEICVYFPNWVRNFEVLERLAQSGADHSIIAHIVNCHRKWEKWPARENSLRKPLEKAFVEQGYEGWSITKYLNGTYTVGRIWRDGELNLDGVKLNCVRDPQYDSSGRIKKFPVGIPFADLAIDVNVHPSYQLGDGYIITRCVQYAAANPTKNYMFPGDVGKLVAKLNDNRPLMPAHLDNATVLRWKKKKDWNSNELPQVETFTNVVDSDDEGSEEDGAHGASGVLSHNVEPNPDIHSSSMLESGPEFSSMTLPGFAESPASDIELDMFVWDELFSGSDVQQTGHTFNLGEPTHPPAAGYAYMPGSTQSYPSSGSIVSTTPPNVHGQVQHYGFDRSASDQLPLQPVTGINGPSYPSAMIGDSYIWEMMLESLAFGHR